MSEHPEDTEEQRRHRAEVEQLRTEVARLTKECLDTTWQDHADHWAMRALKAEAKVEQLREALEAMLYDTTPNDGYPSAAAVERARAALAEKEKK